MGDYSVLALRAGYGKEPLPNDLDQRIQALMQSVRSSEDFAAARSAVGPKSWSMLNAFAERMASIAVRRRSTSDLRDGLVAVQLALALTDDYRDVLPTVSLLYRAAELIGADPSQEFRAVAGLAGNPPDNHLIRYLERSPEYRGIAVMGYAEGSDETGFRFVPAR